MFYYERDGKMVETKTIPYNTYALAGIQDPKDTGLLTVRVHGSLVPLLNAKGDQCRRKDSAGMTFDGVGWYEE